MSAGFNPIQDRTYQVVRKARRENSASDVQWGYGHSGGAQVGTTANRTGEPVSTLAFDANNQMFVDPADEDMLYYGYCYGLKFKQDLSGFPTLKKYAGDQDYIRTHTKAGLFDWVDGAEARCCADIKERVSEALLEVVHSAFDHHHHQIELLDEAIAEAKKMQQVVGKEQRGSNIERIASSKRGLLAGHRGNLAVTLVEMQEDLESKFKKAGDSFDKTNAVVKEHVEGRFGRDWFISGYYAQFDWNDPISAFWLARAEHSKMQSLDQHDRMHRLGRPFTFLDKKLLKPMFKRYVDLGRAYHAPDHHGREFLF